MTILRMHEGRNADDGDDAVTVGPHSKLALYQQRFTAPGMSVKLSAVSTNPPPPQTVNIRYFVNPIRFVRGLHVRDFVLQPQHCRYILAESLLQVVYGDVCAEAPVDRVREYNNGNDDINCGYGGKYVAPMRVNIAMEAS